VIATANRVKPRLQGVFHELGFYAALGTGVALVLTAGDGRPRAAAVVFSACVAICFGGSALYHRPTWTPPVRARLARVDHAGIYLLIAGAYTPFGFLVMSAAWAVPVLALVWSGALAAILLKLLWVRAPKWLSATIGLALGWVGAAASSQLLTRQSARRAARRRKRPPLQGRRSRVRAKAPGSCAACVRIPRALSRADARRDGLSLCVDRVFRTSARLRNVSRPQLRALPKTAGDS
jgi:channel protein (hemolysin III family)